MLCWAGLPLLASAITASYCAPRGAGQDALSAAACAAALGGLALGAQHGGLMAAAAGLVAGQALAAAWQSARVLLPAGRGKEGNWPQSRLEQGAARLVHLPCGMIV
jgi:hypothetical protein